MLPWRVLVSRRGSPQPCRYYLARNKNPYHHWRLSSGPAYCIISTASPLNRQFCTTVAQSSTTLHVDGTPKDFRKNIRDKMKEDLALFLQERPKLSQDEQAQRVIQIARDAIWAKDYKAMADIVKAWDRRLPSEVYLQMCLACARAGAVNELLEVSQGVMDLPQGFFSKVSQALCSTFDFPSAIHILNQLSQKLLQPINATVCEAMLRAYHKNGNGNDAMRVIDYMRNQGMTLSHKLFHTAMDTFRNSGEAHKVRTVLDYMISVGFRPNPESYDKVLEALKTGNRVTLMPAVYNLMLENKETPTMNTFKLMIEGYGARKNIVEIENVLRSMTEHGYKPDLELLIILMNVYGSTGHINRVKKLFEHAKLLGHTSDLYNSMFRALAINRLWPELETLIGEMKMLKLSPFSHTILEIITRFAEMTYIKAMERFLRMTEVFEIPRSVGLWNAILMGYQIAGSTRKVVSRYKQMKAQAQKQAKLQNLSEVTAGSEQPDLSKKLFHEGDIVAPNTETYAIVHLSLRKEAMEGKMVRINKVMEDMTANNATFSLWFYEYQIQLCLKARKLEDALMILQDMEANSVPPELSTFHLLMKYLCNNMRNAENLQNLNKLVRLMKHKEIELSRLSYQIILSGLLKSGYGIQTQNLLTYFRELNMDPELIEGVVQRYLEKLEKKAQQQYTKAGTLEAFEEHDEEEGEED